MTAAATLSGVAVAAIVSVLAIGSGASSSEPSKQAPTPSRRPVLEGAPHRGAALAAPAAHKRGRTPGEQRRLRPR